MKKKCNKLKKKFQILKKLVWEYKKRNSGQNFDCIVPVTGGSDSFFILHTVKRFWV